MKCIKNLFLLVFLMLLPRVVLSKDIKKHAHPGMVLITGGDFWMGIDDDMFPDARPVHKVRLNNFWMDSTEVTNAQFKLFVDSTRYKTLAERPLDPRLLPSASADDLRPGSAVFSAPDAPVALDSPLRWWRFVQGANWLHPEGPNSSINKRMDHPVVHIAYEDVLAYAKWIGKRLPSEAEWEFAARSGLDRKTFVWGDALRSRGKIMANTFQGSFPEGNTGEDGYLGTAPVRAFPPNIFGLYGMAGNVWEWVADWYRADYFAQLSVGTQVSVNPKGPAVSFDPLEPAVLKRVIKGGSFLCAQEYCASFRPGARGKAEPASPAGHIGFRLVAQE